MKPRWVQPRDFLKISFLLLISTFLVGDCKREEQTIWINSKSLFKAVKLPDQGVVQNKEYLKD